MLSIGAAMAMFPLLAQTNAKSAKECFVANFPDIIESFDDLNSGAEKAWQYAFADVDNDGVDEMIVADAKRLRCVFKAVNGKANLISHEVGEDLNWTLVSQFYTSCDASMNQDITLRHHPLFCTDVNLKRNRFTVGADVINEPSVMYSTVYNRMIFKPHVGNVHFVSKQKVDQGESFTFALDKPAMAKKMFRGYSDGQAVPIVVPDAYLKTHNLLQYSRWLEGEPVHKANADERKLVAEYYGKEYRISSMKWLAGSEINERSFYQVAFEPKDGRYLTAFVCIAEGTVVSTRNEWFSLNKEGHIDDFDVEIDDFNGFEPEIMAMVACQAGLELYVRWYSFEGIHYDIWREVADQWVTLQGSYHYVEAM